MKDNLLRRKCTNYYESEAKKGRREGLFKDREGSKQQHHHFNKKNCSRWVSANWTSRKGDICATLARFSFEQ